MGRGRLEAFSDGVLAVIITIMVLELKTPPEHASMLDVARTHGSVLLSYLVSFVYIGIYWNNHHHLFQTVEKINGRLLWANLHLLFWLSLVPFATGWIGESHFESGPVALYGGVLLMAAVAFTILSKSLVRVHGSDAPLGRALGSDTKGKASLLLYVIAIAVAFLVPMVSCGIYLFVAGIWFLPDPRIEKVLLESEANRE
jgi:uncharacterized membrane protein